jgi:transposase-like protein
VAKKRGIGRYPKAFRKMAVERLKGCENIVSLSEELGVHRRLLYKWRGQWEPIDDGQGPPENSKERELRQQVAQLKRLVAVQNAGSRFFQRCLAKSRGSTPEQQTSWRDGIYDQVRELMPMQGNLSIERMCQLAGVSRAGYYRSLQERQPIEEAMEVRSTIQLIFAEHKRRCGYRRVSKELPPRHAGE